MPPEKKSLEYYEARRALNQHLHRHHAGAVGAGTLEDRFEQHDEIHIVAKRLGVPLSHSHSDYPEHETDLAAALRLFKEGEDGQADVAARS